MTFRTSVHGGWRVGMGTKDCRIDKDQPAPSPQDQLVLTVAFT